jgi:hypothetical protein
MAVGSRTSLEQLPNEMLTKCFSYLESSTKDIQNLRQVSKRWNFVSSIFLIDEVSIFIASDSLARLENISRHPIFRKSIRTVNINVSYYDAKLATDMNLFSRNCGTHLRHLVDRWEHFGGSSALLPQADPEVTYGIWLGPTLPSFEVDLDGEKANRLAFLRGVYDEYQRRWEDQEEAKCGGRHLEKICDALLKFPGLLSITLCDTPSRWKRTKKFDVSQIRMWDEPKTSQPAFQGADDSDDESERSYHSSMFSDQSVADICLSSSRWKGTFTTAFITEPPSDIIPGLFEIFEENSIRAKSFDIRVSPPNDLRCLQLTEAQQDSIRNVVGHSQCLSLHMNSWARKDSLGEDNSRSREEMLALCSFTKPFFSSQNMQSLELELETYPVFYEIPKISLLDIFPLDQSWTHLKHVTLGYIPFKVEDLNAFVNTTRNTLTSLKLDFPYLLNGSWVDVLDAFRGFADLQSFDLIYPKGAEFGNRNAQFRNWPAEEIKMYALKHRQHNPLVDFKWG